MEVNCIVVLCLLRLIKLQSVASSAYGMLAEDLTNMPYIKHIQASMPCQHVSKLFISDLCAVDVGYNGNDAKIERRTDVESCKRFCSEGSDATPYFGWLESNKQCYCKTKEDPAKKRNLSGGYVSGPVSCTMPGKKTFTTPQSPGRF